jgi:hypothetical protein
MKYEILMNMTNRQIEIDHIDHNMTFEFDAHLTSCRFPHMRGIEFI